MILVFGATGTVGGQLVRRLAADGHRVRAVTRKPDDAEFPAGVEAVYGDLERRESIAPLLVDAEAVFLLNAGSDADALAEQFSAAGVRRVVFLSALVADTRPDSRIGGAHLRTEEALQRADLDATILRPGQFASNTLQWAAMIRNGTIHAPFADVGIPTIDPYDIAAVAARILTAPDGSTYAGQIYPLTGPAISPRHRAEVLSTVLDRPIGFDELTLAQAKEQLTRHAPPAVVESLLEVLGEPNPAEREELPTVHELLGREPRTFSAWVQDNRAAFG